MLKNNTENKEKKRNPDNVRSRNFTFILYPQENEYHKQIHDYLNDDNPEKIRSIRIHHFGEIYENENGIAYTWENLEKGAIDFCDFYKKLAASDCRCDEVGIREKEHFHYILSFENARTLKSVKKSFGLNGALCSNVSDLKTYFLYCMHMTFDSRNKRRYLYQDWEMLSYNGIDLFNQCCGAFTDGQTKMQTVSDLLLMADGMTEKDLLQKVLITGDSNYLELMMKNPYFIKTFVCDNSPSKKYVYEQAMRETADLTKRIHDLERALLRSQNGKKE